VAIAYAAGTAYVAPRTISAQAIRAVLLANATATTFGRLRSSSRAAQTLPGLFCRANRKTAVAPIKEAPKVSVALLADPDLAFGPATAVGLRRQSQLGRELATGPEQRRVDASGTLAAIALAVIGPMPRIVASRRLASLVRCHLRISASIFSISTSMLRS
jgi:hypothetical protein